MLQSKANWKFTTIQNDTLQWTDDSIDLSPVIKELLLQRGITSAKEAGEFLSPDLANLHDPDSLTSIDKASERIHKAIKQNEKILIYGDYDADGVTSTTVLLKTLQELGATCDFYIPNRFTEGYGPNEHAFRIAAAEGFSIIITVDTGIASVHEAEIAKQLGIDLIITDHHEFQEVLPDAYAIIHPKLSPDYPFHELAGVGVAFKFAQYLLGYFPEHLLDLVAIGTIADLVPLVGENRILAFYGLRKLATTNRRGLQALKKQCRIEGNVTEEDIGFQIGPRLNAVGRLQDADLAVELLMSEDETEAESLAEMVQQLNSERQKIVASIVKEAETMVDPNEKSVIIVAKEGWNEGVLGVVASRLVNKFDRPAIVLAINEEKSIAKGSARSIPAFDLFQNCMQLKDVFTNFGGHSQAAGMTLPLENVKQLQNDLNERIKEQLSDEDFKQVIEVSKTLRIPEINEALIDEINQLAPFGMANPKPVFQIEYMPFEIRQLGNMKNHLKLQFRHDNITLEGIGFGMGDLYSHISPKAFVSVVGELGINEWNGNKKVQIVMQDMKIDEWQLFDHRGKKNIDILPYIEAGKRNVIISKKPFDSLDNKGFHVKQLSYDSNLESLERADTLYLFDLPEDLSQLEDIVKVINPVKIHACFYVENSVYLTAFPFREDFKWLYALIWKRKVIDLKKELSIIMDTKGWTKDNVLFMSKVFLELEFVTIENGVMKLNPAPQKKDLDASSLYQSRIKKAAIEKTLYYSTYDEINNWFGNCLAYLETPKEEVAHGL